MRREFRVVSSQNWVLPGYKWVAIVLACDTTQKWNMISRNNLNQMDA
jgi:hypothetical protein